MVMLDCGHIGLIGFTTLVLAAAVLLDSATAERYTVLDTTGWSIPTTGDNGVYRTWAADKQFKVGDVLFFDFPTDLHDVTKVTKANYNGCDKTNPISTVTTGPANVNLTTFGMHYYICSVGQHCAAGQKLAVKVTAAAADDSNTRILPPARSPPNTKTPAAKATPPISSASSITFGGFSVVILSIVLVACSFTLGEQIWISTVVFH